MSVGGTVKASTGFFIDVRNAHRIGISERVVKIPSSTVMTA